MWLSWFKANLFSQWSRIQFPVFNTPTTIVNKEENILVWYLPGFLDQSQQVFFFFSPSTYQFID